MSAKRGESGDAALGLAWVTGSSGHAILKLLEHRGPGEIWNASPRDLRQWGVGPEVVGRFDEKRKAFSADDARKAVEEAGLRFVPFGSRDYPEQFRQLSVPPAGFFLRGSGEAFSRVLSVPRITIVGTRRATAYGARASEAFASAFAARGIAVLSGMAFGIDTRAHKAAVGVGGLTVAVLGCGADVVYPRPNRWLYEKLARAGAIISELPPGSPPAPWTFPHRNRLLAALGDAVLVIEGGATSGAIQTADRALELGRSVFVVPGSIYAEGYRGCNSLLREGATPAIEPRATVEDFLWETRIERGARRIQAGGGRVEGDRNGADGAPARNLPDRRRDVWTALEGGSYTVDALVARTALAARELMVALAELELEGLVARVGPGLFARAP